MGKDISSGDKLSNAECKDKLLEFMQSGDCEPVMWKKHAENAVCMCLKKDMTCTETTDDGVTVYKHSPGSSYRGTATTCTAPPAAVALHLHRITPAALGRGGCGCLLVWLGVVGGSVLGDAP